MPELPEVVLCVFSAFYILTKKATSTDITALVAFFICRDINRYLRTLTLNVVHSCSAYDSLKISSIKSFARSET